MKIINPSVEIMRTGLETDFMHPEQFIERVGRTCYKSEDRITEDSAAKFVSNLIERGHEAMIEHWNLIFKTNAGTYDDFKSDLNLLIEGSNIPLTERLRPYLKFTDCDFDDNNIRYIVSGNMRAWRDFAKACVIGLGLIPQYMWGMVRNYPLFFPEYQTYVPETFTNNLFIPISVDELNKFERNIHQDVTMKFICDRGVSHEIVRHRVASFAQESTRYCNYGKDKFGKEITVVRPSWCDEDDNRYINWCDGCEDAEVYYFDLLDQGCSPQEARSVLPNSLKTEVIVTMNLDGWKHFFDLRCVEGAQPDMKKVATMAKDIFDQIVTSDDGDIFDYI